MGKDGKKNREPKKPVLDTELGSALSWHDSLFVDILADNTVSVPSTDARDFDELLRDGQARKVYKLLTLPLLSVSPTIEPANGDKGEAALIRELLTRPANAGGMTTPLRLVIAQMLTAVRHRTASFEKVFTTTQVDGKTVIGYRKLAFRPASTTRVLRTREGGYLGLEQDRVGATVTDAPLRIPVNRAFTYVHGSDEQPILGASDMEVALACWRTKQKLKFLWYLFLEARALPKVTVSSSEGGGLADTDKIAKQIASIRGGGVIGIGSTTASVVESAGRAATYYLDALNYLDSEMTASVLGQFSDLASAANSGAGSYALSRDGSDMFLQSRSVVHREMEEQFTAWVIADLVRWNFGDSAAVPRLVFPPLDRETLATILSAIGTLSSVPAPPTDLIEFLVEMSATLLHMPADRVKALGQAQAPDAPAGSVQEAAALVDGVTEAVAKRAAA